MVSARLEKLRGWALVLLAGLAPLVHDGSLYDFANLPQAVFIQAVCFFLPVLAAIGAARERKIRLSFSPPEKALLLFLGWCLASLLWSHNRTESWTILRHWLAGAIACFWVARLPLSAWRGPLFVALSLASLGVSLLGIAQHLFLVDWVPQAVPPAATFGNKNMAAEFVSLALPLNLCLLLTAPRQPARFLAGAAICLCLVFLWFTRTLTAWLAIAGAASFLLLSLPPWGHWLARRGPLLVRFSIRRLLAGMAVLILLAGGATFMLFHHYPGNTNRNIRDTMMEKAFSPTGSFAVRTHMWRNGLAMAAGKPLSGFGLGHFRIFYPAYHTRAGRDITFSAVKQPRNIHNDYLQLAVELGFPGLLLFLAIPLLAGREVQAALRHTATTRHNRSVLLCCSASFFVFAVLAAAAYPLHRSVSSLLFFVTLGLVIAQTRPVCPPEEGAKSIPLARKAGIMAALFSLLLYGLFMKVNGDIMTADRYYKASQQAEHAGDWPAARTAAEQATKLAPGNDEMLSALGLALAKMNVPNQAITVFRTALDRHPYNVNVLINLAAALKQQGEQRERAALLERILDILPDEPETLKSLGALCLREGKNDAALEYYSRLVQIAPNDARSHANLGYLYGKKDQYAEAAEVYEKALLLDPGLIDIHRSLSVIYSRHLDQPEKAALHLRQFQEKTGKEGSGQTDHGR